MPTDDTPLGRRKVVAWMEREMDTIAQVYRAESLSDDRDEISIHHLVGAGAILQKLADVIASGDLDAEAES